MEPSRVLNDLKSCAIHMATGTRTKLENGKTVLKILPYPDV